MTTVFNAPALNPNVRTFCDKKKKLPLFRKRDRFTKEHSHADLKDVPHTCLQILGSKGHLIYRRPTHETQEHRQQCGIGNVAHWIGLTQLLNKFQEDEI